MNIALLTEKFIPDFGGLAVSAGRLAGGLAAHGHQVTVFHLTRTVPPGRAVTLQMDGVTILRTGASARTDDTLGAWFDQVCASHSARSFDLLHGFYLVQAGYVAALAGRFLNVPSVVSARGNDLDRAIFDPGKAAHILYALRHAAAVTTNTNELARKAAALGASLPAVVIPNGVDSDLFCPGMPDPALARQLGLETGELRRPVIGFTGEARAKKGLDTLLAAIALLVEQYVDMASRPLLLMVGGARKGPDREALEAFQAVHPGLVEVLPPQPLASMPAFYRLLDVLALPSRHDGLPNALLEGMSCGLATAATPVGGMVDVLQDGENALLVPPDDPQALAVVLRRLLDDPELRQKLGTQARAEVKAKYGLAQELESYEAVYRAVSFH